ncbi:MULTISPECIES: phage tail sheath subtilisin-like domain-containing protein [unclassified Streptomyces]|uniref:phage tail sheath family protein n=1 Tax=unclassified Streptomyces TaxID=2593676 RepID=UPI00225C3DAA|nr:MULTISPECIES: phage tail sheath subtilisin-like domain-containing protein [unclassified Streptomyces]MCX5328351.1 phage tail sheath subtilisin-like domain-containing protein [Streptomyces sp. NBC_00140]MCX5357767.1 phage tail sheath subtilisin-like domain-containing protein [Streptomyces sp. NBC_00124]
MVDYETKAPGVYIEEQPATGPIAGAGTGTAALIGTPVSSVSNAAAGIPVVTTSWTDYVTQFGGFKTSSPLPYAVRGFFDNGGAKAYVVPVKDVKDAAGMAAALEQLTRVQEVNLVCAPGLVDAGVQSSLLTHCEAMGNRFAILDGATDNTPLKADGVLQTQRGGLLSKGGWGGLYWPWILVDDPAPTPPGTTLVPPSGHIAGIMARVDGAVGVHKAPANEVVRGARNLSYTLNDTEQGTLNHAGVNAIRLFPGRPPMLWGARTLTDGTAWRYVNVRRLVAYVEESLLQGLRWAVFSPNTTGLWKTLERTISEFLARIWQAGALFGRTAQEAFYVRIDEELNPAAVRNAGQVIVEIGLSPVRPAEFVVVRLGLWDGGSRATES